MTGAQIRLMLRLGRNAYRGLKSDDVDGRTARSLVGREMCCEIFGEPSGPQLWLTAKGNAWLDGFYAGQAWEGK